MKKITLIFLFASFYSNAQIDYKALVRNLEDVNSSTDLKTYFKGLPITTDEEDVKFNDERFLRFYGVTVREVKFGNDWEHRTMSITPFDEKADYDTIKLKLIEIYGEPELDERGTTIVYNWENENKEISLSVNFAWEPDDEDAILSEHLNEAKFETFENVLIIYKQ